MTPLHRTSIGRDKQQRQNLSTSSTRSNSKILVQKRDKNRRNSTNIDNTMKQILDLDSGASRDSISVVVIFAVQVSLGMD